jgi:hypothetical protein
MIGEESLALTFHRSSRRRVPVAVRWPHQTGCSPPSLLRRSGGGVVTGNWGFWVCVAAG